MRVLLIEVKTIQQLICWIFGWLDNIGRQMYQGNFSALILIANLWAVAIGYRTLRLYRKTQNNRKQTGRGRR